MRELLRDRRFVIFWLGQAISTLGDGMTPIALAALVLKYYGTSGFGTVLACYSLGFGLPLLIGGVIADRYPRGLVMAAADATRLLVVAGYLVFAGDLPLYGMGVLAALSGFGSAMYAPSYRASLAQLLDPELLRKANAMQGLANKGALALGGALAGLLVATAGARWAFAVDGATFVVSIVTLLAIRLPRVERSGETANVFRDAADGVRAVWRKPWVAVVMAQGTVQVVAGIAPVMVLLPVVATHRYGPGGYGVLAVAQAVGLIAGSLLMLRYKPRRDGLTAMNAIALYSLVLVCLAVPVPLWAFVGAQFVAWVGIDVFVTLWYSALQREFPGEVQGRVFSLDAVITFALNPLGLALTPALVVAFGATPLVVGAAIVMIISSYAVLVVRGVPAFATPSTTLHESAETSLERGELSAL